MIESGKWLEKSTSPYLLISGCCSPSSSLPPEACSSPQQSGWGETKVGFFGHIPHSWGSGAFTHMLSLLLQKKSCAEGVCLGTELGCLGRGIIQELFVFPSSVHLISVWFFCFFVFLLQQCTETSLDSWTSTKTVLSMGNCQNLCSLGR